MLDNRTAFDRIGLRAVQRRLDLARGIGRNHFGFELGGRRIGYCYVRKNGCSSFKRMFLERSPHRDQFQEGERPIDFMRRYHRLTLPELQGCDHLIFVYRDPVERMLSMFRNKFIARSGAEDIRRSYARITGQSVDDSSFRQFIDSYLTADIARLDPHVVPQRMHLQRAVYTDVLPMSGLHAGMRRILGKALADEYFLRPANSTFHVPLGEMPGAAEAPIGELAALYASEGLMPDNASLLPPDLERSLKSIYAMDYEIISATQGIERSA